MEVYELEAIWKMIVDRATLLKNTGAVEPSDHSEFMYDKIMLIAALHDIADGMEATLSEAARTDLENLRHF